MIGLDLYQIAPAVSGEMLRPLLESGATIRMHVNNGAVASFVDTIPLLHPYGWMICHDVFVTDPLPTDPLSLDLADDYEPFLAGYPEDVGVAVKAINIVTQGVDVTWGLHVCYGNRYARPSWEGHYDFLFPAVLDTNVGQLILEFGREGHEDLHVVRQRGWDRALGLGVVDVKSEQIESAELIAQRIRKALETFPASKLIINPDCGLRHLPADVAGAKLAAMVEGTSVVRRTLSLGHPGTPTEHPETSSEATVEQGA